MLNITLDFHIPCEKDYQKLSYLLNAHMRGLSLEQWKAGYSGYMQ